MKTSTNRMLRSSIVAILAGVLLFLAGPSTLLAQQTNQEKSVIKQHKKKQEELRKKAGIEKQSQQGLYPKPGIDLGSLTDKYATFTNDQSWLFGNPEGNFDTPPDNSGQWAGDINGDNDPDYIMRGTPHGPESIVYFGGNTSIQPDQKLDRWVTPVGDVDNDGYTDAVTNNGEILLGSDSGYEGSGNNMPYDPFGDFGRQSMMIPAGDLDGDGTDDVILVAGQRFSGPEMFVFWGDDSGNALQTLENYYIDRPVVDSETREFIVNTGDFDGSGDQEFYIFGFNYQTNNEYIRILDLDANRNLVLEQDFEYNQTLEALDVTRYAINVLDLNADGFTEIFLRPSSSYQDASNYVYTEDSNTGMFNTTAVNVYNGMAWPVGDLNDDGNIDFHLGDPDADNEPYIDFGPDTYSEGVLTLNKPLNLASSNEWTYYYNTQFPYKDLGDINGDGIDDYVLGLNDEVNHQLGRAFVYGGSSSGEITSENVLTDEPEFIDYISDVENVGDVNGDGLDDFAINRQSSETIEVFYGDSSSIGGTPDVTLNADYTFQSNETGRTISTAALGIAGGDFNDDGYSDIAVSDNYGVYLHIYNGGESMSADPSTTIKGDNFKDDGGSVSHFYFVKNIGDVNADGVEDLMLGSLYGSYENSSGEIINYNEAYLFYGGNIGSSPNETIQLASEGPSIGAGWNATALGDLNGDNHQDFAISSPFINGNRGKVDVFYGKESGDFGSPDLTLSPSSNANVFGYGYSLAGGDFNGDSFGDLAISKQFTTGGDSESSAGSNIDIVEGGENADNEPDHYLTIDPRSVGLQIDRIGSYTGEIESIPDHDGNNSDELVAFNPGISNAVIFSGNMDLTQQQTLVLEGKNQNSGLGLGWNQAVGDFNGDGQPAVIADQSSSGSSYIDAAHIYNMPDPIKMTSIEDVPEDQGGWVRVNTDGYYMDAIDQDIIGFDHWAVWRQDQETMEWTNVATVPAHGTDAKYVDVRVPNTRVTGSEADSSNYKFKVTALNSAENTLAASSVDSGYALDNISPNAVSNVIAERNDSEVVLSWDASEANDLNEYEVISGDNTDDPIATTFQNSVTLSDSEFSGIQELSVRARDIHENAGDLSSETLAAFQTDLPYQVQSRWNLIGIPLDADQEEINSLLDNVEGDKLYEYSGSYEQVAQDEVEAGKGYWAKFSSSESYAVTGLPLTSLSLDLTKGWNMISGVGASLTFDQIQDQDGILIEGTLRSFNGSYQEADSVKPAAGYWIRTSEAGSVTLALGENPTEMQAKESKPKLAEVKDELNEVTLRSSGGYKSTLYFGDELPESVNPLSFSLPPVAPGETFDMRFASNNMSYVEGNTFTVNVEKQDRANDLTLSLDLQTTNKHQSYKVEERRGTDVIAEYRVNGNKDVTLKNSDVTSVSFSPAGTGNLAQQSTPDKFELEPSYPNPFNPSTTIKYQIPEQVDVNVEVYNMAGQKVRTLIAGEQQEAGTHTVRFNASNLSSGVYFVQMRAGSFEQIQKITLIK